MAISRMQQPRQQYGLGSLVKKAVRGVKKIVKSPIGKAALLGGLGMYAGGLGPWSSGGMWGQAKGAGFLRNMMAARNAAGAGKFLSSGAAGGARLPSAIAARNPGFFSKMLGGAGKLLNPWQSGSFSGKHAFGLASAAALAAPFLMKGEEPEEIEEESWTQIPSSIADIRSQAKDYYRNPASSTLSFMPRADFINKNFYAADGGRAGLMNGGMTDTRMIKNQPHRLAYITPNEVNKLKALGGQETMTPEGIPAYPEWDSMYGAESKEAFDAGQAPRGNVNWSGGGDNNNTIVSPPDNPVSDNYPNVGPLFNTELVNRNIALNKALANYDLNNVVEDENEEDQNINTTGVTQDTINTLFNPAVASNIDQIKTTTSNLLKADSDLMASLDLKAQGGRVGLLNGGEAGHEQIEQMLMAEFVKYKNQGGTLTFEQFVQAVMQAQEQQPEGAGMEQPQEVAMASNGGRIGAYAGGPMDDEDETTYNPYKAMAMYKRPGKQEGGIMETEEASEMIDMNGQEKDYRETGGFVDLGGKERADDVPARLSKNEFVFTADAVRNAGGGDIDKGSEVMQNLMDNLEAGGEISEESQGLEGAQAMYDQQQMLQSRIA